MKTEKAPQISVGVDLHKQQFTVNALNEESGEILLEEVYRTTREGYEDFCKKMHEHEEKTGCSIRIAVEATGNARFFKNRMESEGFEVLVVNTNKFKVITMSTKKTDANDASTLAYYLSKDMLPESHLCDQTSEGIKKNAENKECPCIYDCKDQESNPRNAVGIWNRNQRGTIPKQKKKAGIDERSRGSRLLTIHCPVTRSDTEYFRQYLCRCKEN